MDKNLELALRIKADLAQGKKELGEFRAVVSAVGDDAQTASQQLERVGESATQQAARIQAMVAASLQQQAALDGVAASTNHSTTAAAANAAQWQQTAAAQTAVMTAHMEATRAAEQLAAAEARTAAAAQKSAADIEREGQELTELLGRIDPVIRELERLDVLEQRLRSARKAGRLDVESFDVYNAKLAEQRTRLTATTSATRAAALTAGQYQQAMRQLPMQITDVTTSLASGMPVWMVAIQQGGQIKDSFGGIVPAARAVISAISPMVLAVGAAAATVGALALAYKQGSDEATGYNTALILTGNAAGTTATQLAGMAQRIDAVSGTQHQAAAALTEVANTGKFTAEQIERIGTVAVLMQNTTGRAVSETVADFARLADDPVKAVAALNERYHFLTSAVYEQIRALQQQGNQTDAAKLAIDTYAAAMKDRTGQIESNLGTLEKAWRGIKNGAAEAWDAMLDIGREHTLDERIERLQKQIAQIETPVAGAPAMPNNGATAGLRAQLAALEAERTAQAPQRALEEAQANAAAKQAQINKASIEAQQEIATLRDQSLTKAEKKEKEIAAYRRNIEKIRAADPNSRLVSQANVDKDIANIEAKYAEPKKRTPTTDTSFAALNKQITERAAALKAATDAESKLTETQKFSEQVLASLADGTTKLTEVQKASIRTRLEELAVADRANQAKADQKALIDVQTKLLSAQGQTAAAAAAQVEKEYADLIARLKSRGDQAGQDLVQKLINVEGAKAQLSELQGQIDRVFGEQSRAESGIQAQQQAGLISEIGARQQIIDLHARTATEVEKLLPKMEELAQATGDPAAIERVKDLQAQLARTRIVADELTNAFKAGFEDGLANALRGLAEGTMDLQEAALSFVRSIASAMADLAAQKLAAQAYDTVADVFSSSADAASNSAAAAANAANTTAVTVNTTATTASATAMGAAATAAGALATALTAAAAAAASKGTSDTIGSIVQVAAKAATGGHVTGPGSGTSDSIRAWLSNNEFVTRAAVVTQPGALSFLHDFNARGMYALDDWASAVRHATGGLAGVPAPAMRSPGLGMAMAEPSSSETTLKNQQNFYLVDDPSRIAEAAFGTREGISNMIVAISRDPGKFRSVLGIN